MAMRMMLLLGSAVLLLVGPTVSSPTRKPSTPFDPNLSETLDLIEKYNATFQEEFFVEDVSDLAVECGDKFFCKVQSILHAHGNKNVPHGLFRNINMFVTNKIKNCKELLHGMSPPTTKKPVIVLLDKITHCVQKKNLLS